MIKLSEGAQAVYKKYGRGLIYRPEVGAMQLCMDNKVARKLLAEHKAELQEIKGFLKAQYEEKQAAIKLRADKRASIPGLKELTDARKAMANYREAYNRAWERGDGRLPVCPNIDLDALAQQFPRASALLKAEAWSEADNDAKAAAGKAAADAIINGDDYTDAISTMVQAWTTYCDNRIFD